MSAVGRTSPATVLSGLRDRRRAVPVLALVVLVLVWGRSLPSAASAALAVLLAAAVLAAVHHAEVVAHRVGEPFGSLILAVAVTIIEVGMILSLMSAGGPGTEGLARDTVFAAVMISCNGIIGLSILAGVRRHGLIHFNPEGSGGALATVLTLATVCFVLPNVTVAEPGPEFSSGQLVFAALASLALYGLFVVTQTVRHRDFFLPVGRDGEPLPEDAHAEPPPDREAWVSLGLLVACLVAVVGLAKVLSKPIEDVVASAGLPNAFVGVVIALLVLAPETLAAVKAARRDRLQTSFNLGFGSAIASIGLTVPVLAVVALVGGTRLDLGLTPTHTVLLAITAAVAVLTVVPGRATRLQGGVHLVLFAAFVYLAANP